MDFKKLVRQAEGSKFGRWKLNFLLQRFVPFNKPHRLKVLKLNEEQVQVQMPYIKNNLNHLKGLHACGLATAAEYASGLLLLYRLGFKQYRLIMESIEVKYHYQGKNTAVATFSISQAELDATILKPLEKDGVVYKKCEIKVTDAAGNLLCTAYTNWQIKQWEKVKLKVD